MIKKTFIKELRCILTEDDKAAIGKKMAQMYGKYEDVEAEKASTASRYSSELKIIRRKIGDLSKRYREGFELRDVECLIQMSWSEGFARTIRLDTMEMVSERPITPDERQRKIDEQPSNDDEKNQGDAANVDSGGDSGGEAVGIEADGQIENNEFKRDDKELKELLSKVMKKAPTVKTIKQYKDSEYLQAQKWAESMILIANSETSVIVQEVFDKPAFLGK